MTVIRMPIRGDALDRIVARDREANIREEQRESALDIIRNHAWHKRQDIEDALVTLLRVGTDHEKKVAQEQIDLILSEQPDDTVERRKELAALILGGLAVVALVVAGVV